MNNSVKSEAIFILFSRYKNPEKYFPVFLHLSTTPVKCYLVKCIVLTCSPDRICILSPKSDVLKTGGWCVVQKPAVYVCFIVKLS